jgi:radical SAM protein with 4Fe4S-binding SPASM domain
MEKGLCQIINDYRLNIFVIKVNVRDGWMLYNTTTGSIVYIHSTEDLYKSLDKLIDMYYYVPLAFDEVMWVNKLRITKNSESKDRLINGFTIFTTMDCNARCFYCYEKGKHRISMTDKIAKDTAEFILKTSSNTPVDIRWFGGEPLLNTNAIDIICNTITKNGARFKSSMITNGLLFTDSIILKAKNLWKLKRVQITLDGPKDVYQRTKSYKGAVGDEFERVIDNISKLIEAKIRVSIRLNQGLYNTSDLLELIDILSDHFGGKDMVSVYNSLLYDEKVEPNNLSGTEMYESFIRVQNKLIKSGLFRSNPLKKKIRFCHCMADNDSSVIITPKGEIGKCEHFTNNHLVGNIYDSQFDLNEILRWKEQYQPTLKCLKCPLYPQCVRIKMCPEERELCTLSQCENKIELIQRALLKKFELLTRK